MSTLVEIEKSQEQSRIGQPPLARSVGLIFIFLACGLAIFVFGSNYYSLFPTNGNIAYEAGVTAFFLIAALILRSQRRYQQYWQVAYAFFVAAAVILTTSLTADFRASLLRRAGLSVTTSQGLAVEKVFEALVTIPTILVLWPLAGISLKSLYIQRGNLRWGLILGIGFLINFASSALMFFYDRFTSVEALIAAVVWGMVFSLANGFMEELWLRGQFLQKLEPLIGSGMAIGLTALWWSIFHLGADYFSPVAIALFLLNLVTFGLAFGFAMKRTDSIIAPGLMHAASDLFLFIAKLSSI